MSIKPVYRKHIDEPTMSDKTLLVSVEDLIASAFGPMEKNTVNFKLVQTILHILARQLRLLEQDVEIKFDDLGIDFETGRPYDDSADNSSDYDYYSDDESYSSGSRGARKERIKKKGEKERGAKWEKGEKKEKGEKWEKGEKKERGEKETKKERGEKGPKMDRPEKGKDKGETGEKTEKRPKDRRRGSKDKESSSPDGRVYEDDDGKGRDGRGKRYGGRRKRGEDDEDEGGERDGSGRRHGGRRRGEDDEVEGGERDGYGRRPGGRRRRGEDDEVEGGERDGYGRRPGGRRRRDEDDEVEGGERDGYGRRYGGRRRRGADDEDEGGERDGYGRRRGGQRRRGEDDGDEGGERDSRRYGRRHREKRGDYYDRDEQGRRRRVDREGSGTSITVTEGQPRGGGAGTVLIAERGPRTRGRVARVGSIEVVTASQFALLARAVRQLEQVTGPMPVPELPDNEQLREDVLKGRASLSDTMEAVQLNARVQAAEEGLSRMAGLLTQLTAAGALPMDFASRIGNLQAELHKSTMSSAERRGGPGAEDAEHDEADAGAEMQKEGGPDSKPDESMPVTRFSVGAIGASATSKSGGSPTYDDMPVTHNEMQDILEQMKEALSKEIQAMTARANHSADIASNTSRNVSEKLAIAMAIDERISTLFSQTADYAEQLNGFDTGLTTQMASFQEQMTMMRTDLKGGLELLESANNNAETAAVLDLTERYETLVLELDSMVHVHSNLSIVQHQISDELKTLVECVEMLREQKADRDEVLDGLRDKADISRLSGLLYEKDFAQARFEIEKRIQKSYDKFYKQDEIWQIAMKDLTQITEHKAEEFALMAFKDRANKELNLIQEKQHQLEVMLGEPQAALLTRQLAAGAACGSCLARAVMPLTDATHGKPALLPALRPAPLGAEEPCLADVALRPLDTRRHICHRWVGGSHTLMAGNVSHEKAAKSHLETIPTKKYEGYGTDGKLYMMEEELLPCGECNKLSAGDAGDLPPPSPTPTGGGDHELVDSKRQSTPRSDHD